MALSDYTGRSPGGGSGPVVSRVRPHRVWVVDGEAHAECANCEATLPLTEGHLRATLAERPNREAVARVYLCDEDCVAEWVGVE